MSCYVTFFNGDITEQGQVRQDANFDIEKVPVLFYLNQRSDLGACFDVFPFDDPKLLTKEHIARIRDSVNVYQNDIRHNMSAIGEIKNALLKNLPTEDYEEAVTRIHDLNEELEELTGDLDFSYEKLGALEVAESLINDGVPVTVVVG